VGGRSVLRYVKAAKGLHVRSPPRFGNGRHARGLFHCLPLPSLVPTAGDVAPQTICQPAGWCQRSLLRCSARGMNCTSLPQATRSSNGSCSHAIDATASSKVSAGLDAHVYDRELDCVTSDRPRTVACESSVTGVPTGLRPFKPSPAIERLTGRDVQVGSAVYAAGWLGVDPFC
jgi:hypothetical protein